MYVDPPWPYRSEFLRDVITEGDDLCDPKSLDIGEHDGTMPAIMKLRGPFTRESVYETNPGRG